MISIAHTAVSFALLGSVITGNIPTILTHQVATTKPVVQHVSVKQSDTKINTSPPTPTTVMVTVQSGDTLSSIAASNATTYVRLYDANTIITDPNIITPGQQLRVPAADEQLTDRPLPQTTLVTTTTTATVASATVSYPTVNGNDAKAFIYSHESGNNPNATNASGCYGLGQDCNGKVRSLCGADYACQDAYFTSYATSRYGSWDAAAAFWQIHGWW